MRAGISGISGAIRSDKEQANIYLRANGAANAHPSLVFFIKPRTNKSTFSLFFKTEILIHGQYQSVFV